MGEERDNHGGRKEGIRVEVDIMGKEKKRWSKETQNMTNTRGNGGNT